MGVYLVKDPNLYGDIILSSEENIEMIKRFHQRFTQALLMIENHDKQKFVDSFNKVSEWFGDYSQQFMTESQNLLKQANDAIQRS